jgi:flagellar biosynthesis GTPase FlhF
MPEKIEECKRSVLEDNPDMDESRAYAICQAQENEGNLSDVNFDKELQEDDPCEEGYTMVGTKQQDGQTVPNCVPVEDVGELEPPRLSGRHVLGGSKQLADRIEREKVDENTVRYNGIKALTEGVWTDQESRESIHYMPENLEVELGSDVNVMHDQSDVSESGEIVDFEHGEDARGKDAIFVDFELNTDTEAGAYADKALQTALESDGQEGFGGPSVEIPPEGQDIRPDGPRGHPYTASGKIDGLGLVGQPAAKDTAFAYQTQERAVALSDGSNALMLEKEGAYMPEIAELRKALADAGIEADELEDDDVKALADNVLELAEGEYKDDEEEEEEDTEMQEGEEEEEEEEMEEEEMEMMDDEAREVMQDMINEELDDMWGELDEIEAMVEEMQDKMASESELSEAREELAEADTVEEIEKTLSEVTDTVEKIAEEPNNEDRTLAEGSEWEPEYDDTGVSHSPSW